MDLQQLMPWLLAANTIITLGTAVYALMTASAKKVAADMTEALKKLTDHDRRIQAVEGELKHLPDKDVVHRLELTLADLRNEMTKVAASADQSARTSARVETYLMEKGGK